LGCGVSVTIAGILALILVPMLQRDYLGPNSSGDDDKRYSIDKLLTNSVGMKLALLPAGKFKMGEPNPNGRSKQGDDLPDREVTISKSFYLGLYEVTQSEYEKVVGRNTSYFNAKN